MYSVKIKVVEIFVLGSFESKKMVFGNWLKYFGMNFRVMLKFGTRVLVEAETLPISFFGKNRIQGVFQRLFCIFPK